MPPSLASLRGASAPAALGLAKAPLLGVSATTPHGTSAAMALAMSVSIALALCAAPAGATVVMKEKSTSSGFQGWGAGNTTSTLTIAGDKQREESEFLYTGKLKTLAGKNPSHSVGITRLDKELIWQLDPDHKSYTEVTFAELRQRMAEGAQQLQEAQAGSNEKMKEASESRPEMTFTVDVKRTGAKRDINGFATEQAVITCIGKPAQPQPGQENAEVRITFDLWLAKNVPGQDEVQGFRRRFAEKIGLDPELQRGMTGLMGKMYTEGLTKAADKLKDLDGYPILSTFSIESPQMGEARKQAATEEAKAARQQAATAEEEATASAAGAATAGDAKGAASGLLGGKLAGMMAKKRAEKKEAQAAAPAQSTLWSVTTEVLSVSADAAGVSFDVPPDFKRVARPATESSGGER